MSIPRIFSNPYIFGQTVDHLIANDMGLPMTVKNTRFPEDHKILTREEATEEAAKQRARLGLGLVSREFRNADRCNLSLLRNADVGLVATQKSIESVLNVHNKGRPIPLDEKPSILQGRLKRLFEGNAHIRADFSEFSFEQANAVLDVLLGMATRGETGQLHNVYFDVPFKDNDDTLSLNLAKKVDQTIDAIRATSNGSHAAFRFTCFSKNALRTNPPDFSELKNLTGVNLSGCIKMTAGPDFSNNPRLISVDLTDCARMPSAPDFSHNPDLRSVNLSECVMLTSPPSFDDNEELEQVDFSHCYCLESLPEFKNNPCLLSVKFSNCVSLRTIPDFSKNNQLTKIEMQGCDGLHGMTHFPKIASLKYLDMSDSPFESAPNFSGIPNVIEVVLSDSPALTHVQDFSNHPNLLRVNLSHCEKLTNVPKFSNKDILALNLTGSSALNIKAEDLLEEYKNLYIKMPDFKETEIDSSSD